MKRLFAFLCFAVAARGQVVIPITLQKTPGTNIPTTPISAITSGLGQNLDLTTGSSAKGIHINSTTGAVTFDVTPSFPWTGLSTGAIYQATSATTAVFTLTPTGLTSLGVNSITANSGNDLSLAAASVFKLGGATLVDHADPFFLKQVFAAGQGIAFITPIHQSFEEGVGSNGLIPIPSANEPMLGYHAMFSPGFFDSNGTLIIRNSWGQRFGDAGYGYMPFEMILSWTEAWTLPNAA